VRSAVTHARTAVGIVAMAAVFGLTPTETALAAGIHPVLCGKLAPIAGVPEWQALAARADPYRIVATFHYQESKKPQDKRVMRFGTSAWGYTHIRQRRKWNSAETYVIVGCVLTYGRRISRQGHAYVFRYRFSGAPGKFAGEAFEVIYETSNGPKGVITAYPANNT
jgi:hypothetical protein